MKTEIGLGTWAFGQDYWQDQEERDSIRTIHRALREGITHFDTAQAYGKGRSEQVTGQQLRRFRQTHPRDMLTIDTKIMLHPRMDAASLRKAVEKSLRRLCISYIDTCYIHWPLGEFSYAPVLDELARLRQAHTIRHIGVSNFPPDLAETLARRWPITDYQGAYSLLWRGPDTRLIPFCRKSTIRFTAYGVLAQGILGDTPFPPSDNRSCLVFSRPPLAGKLSPLIEEYRRSCRAWGLTPAQAAFRWMLTQGIDRVLIGTRTPEQLSHLLHNCRTPLPQELLDQLEQFSTRCMDLLPAQEDNIFSHRW